VGGFFAVDDILEYLKVNPGNYGPLEIRDANLSSLLVVSRVYSQDHTSGFQEGIPLP
jgi:hypothetical protein